MARELAPWHRGRGSVGPISRLHEEMDRMFGDFFQAFDQMPSAGQWQRGALTPQIDVSESEKAYEVRAELPGVDEKDIDVTVQGDVLIIKGEKKAEQETKDKHFHRIERSYGMFERALPLGDNVDVEKVEADFRKGVLTVKVPKKTPAPASVKKVEVRPGE